MSRLLAGLVVLLAGAGAYAQGSSASADITALATNDAIFAGGCFWGMEEAFEHIPGVQRLAAIWGPPA